MVNGPIDQGRFNAPKLLRETSAISEPYLIDGAGKEQLCISRIPIELAATQQDYSRNPKFTEAMPNKFYYGPVYFRGASEAFMTLSISGTGGEVAVRVAEIQISHDIEGREVLMVYAPVTKGLGWLMFVELPTGGDQYQHARDKVI